MRLLVLKFVRDYFREWGGSPSYGEIAAALQTDRTRARRAANSLVADGLLLRRPGPRGLTLPQAKDEAVRVLRELGWQVDEDISAASKATLPPAPVLDYDPVHGVSIANGQAARTKAGDKSRTGTAAGE